MADNVHVQDLMAAFSWRRSSSVTYFVREGVLDAPSMVDCPDGRTRCAWPRDYLDRLLADPPPRLAVVLQRARARGAAP